MKYKLKDCTLNITDGTHSTVINDENGKNFLLSCKNIKDGNILISNDDRKINDETLNKLKQRTKLAKGDVLVTTVGTLGEMAYIKDDNINYDFQRSVGILKPDPKIVIPEYLYYLLKKEKNKVLEVARGTSQQCIFLSELKNIEIDIVDIEVQKKIVNVLNKIDYKISLNTHTNNNLQELLLSQYKLYFENKEINGKLKDIVSKTNRTIKKDSINKSLKYYPIDILPKNDIILQDGKNIEEAQSSLIEFKNNEILVGAMRVYFHRVCLSNYSGITRNTTFVLKPISDEYIYYSLLTIYQDSFIDYASLTSKGTTMPYAVWENVCSEYNIYIPTKNELQEFNIICKAIIDKMNINQKENSKLEQIRDTLLPKLMNGEIDLDKIEI